MSAYALAQTSFITGVAISVGATIASAFDAAPAFLADVTSTGGGDILDILLKQGGLFTVVIVVFKFMLGRQDVMAQEFAKKEDLVDAERLKQIEDLKAQLEAERLAHLETREKMVECLLAQQQNK